MLKRDVIKYIRDKAKSNYVKGTECRICKITEDLDFHHFTTISHLVHNWIKANGLNPEDVLEFRDRFIEEHQVELYEDTVTLCHFDHLRLHSIYGKEPSLATAKKQARWVELQREKFSGNSN